MLFPEAQVIELDHDSLEATLEGIPDEPAVFLVEPRTGDPYIGRTSLLRRRLRSLLRQRTIGSRTLSLAGLSKRVLIWPAVSQLGGNLLHYEITRRWFPADYRKRLRLPTPAYVKLLRGNEYPRTQVSQRPTEGPALWFGPFRTRAEADLFETEMLDLFAIRRCLEDLAPDKDHPGCIYGEMGKCLRPCQLAVDRAAYLEESERVASFLATRGRSAMAQGEAARDEASAEMNFEEAALQHRRLDQLREVIKAGGELACELDHLDGLAICPGKETVELWPMAAGVWQSPVRFSPGEPASIEAPLREAFEQARLSKGRSSGRTDHLALLSRWYHASWREGDWFPLEDATQLLLKPLLRRIGKVATSCISATSGGG